MHARTVGHYIFCLDRRPLNRSLDPFIVSLTSFASFFIFGSDDFRLKLRRKGHLYATRILSDPIINLCMIWTDYSSRGSFVIKLDTLRKFPLDPNPSPFHHHNFFPPSDHFDRASSWHEETGPRSSWAYQLSSTSFSCSPLWHSSRQPTHNLIRTHYKKAMALAWTSTYTLKRRC